LYNDPGRSGTENPII